MPSMDLSQGFWQEISMFLKIKSSIDGLPVVIIVRAITEQRLASEKGCFRGTNRKLAGNFSVFSNCREVFDNIYRPWLSGFMDDVARAYRNRERTASYSFDYGMTIGWSGTDDVAKYRPEELEDFNPNRRSVAKRVKADQVHIYAPRTALITFVYEVRPEADQMAVVIHSIYPGKDIGELVGDITANEGVVFFDWNHPGWPV